MSALETIENQVLALPKAEVEKLQDWLSDYLEDEAELNPDFVAGIERGNAQIAEGQARTFQP